MEDPQQVGSTLGRALEIFGPGSLGNLGETATGQFLGRWNWAKLGEDDHERKKLGNQSKLMQIVWLTQLSHPEMLGVLKHMGISRAWRYLCVRGCCRVWKCSWNLWLGGVSHALWVSRLWRFREGRFWYVLVRRIRERSVKFQKAQWLLLGLPSSFCFSMFWYTNAEKLDILETGGWPSPPFPFLAMEPKEAEEEVARYRVTFKHLKEGRPMGCTNT